MHMKIKCHLQLIAHTCLFLSQLKNDSQSTRVRPLSQSVLLKICCQVVTSTASFCCCCCRVLFAFPAPSKQLSSSLGLKNEISANLLADDKLNFPTSAISKLSESTGSRRNANPPSQQPLPVRGV